MTFIHSFVSYFLLVSTIFLYNSELWTFTKTNKNAIDNFQRRLLRRIMNIRYPQIITNEELYRQTQQTPWSTVIRTRRLRWFGHLMRLPDETPARQALDVFQNVKVKRPQGAPRKTWLSNVQDDLKLLNKTMEEAQSLARNRIEWRKLVFMSYCSGLPS